MKTKRETQFEVSNTFEIFGDPCPEYFDTKEEANEYIYENCEALIKCFWTVNGDRVLFNEPDHNGEFHRSRTGMSNETEWQDRVTEKCDENGFIDKELLIDFMGEAFEIEEF